MKAGVLERHGGGMELALEGFGKGYFKFGGLKPQTSYRLSVVNQKKASVFTRTLTADASGSLEVTTQFSAPPSTYHLRLAVK
jgi:hypothetical protein